LPVEIARGGAEQPCYPFSTKVVSRLVLEALNNDLLVRWPRDLLSNDGL
jgi:hypothetical protein